MTEEEVKEARKQSYIAGEYFARGVIKTLVCFCVIFWVVAAVLAVGKGLLGIGTNNSDLDGFRRSGFHVRTDYGTRVQYLVTPEGHAIPRVNKDGQTILIPEGGK